MTAQQTQKSSLVSYFSAGQLSKPSSLQDRFDIYRLIQSGAFKDQTDFILKKYGQAILDGFPDGKQAYQADKKRLLPSVCFSGAIDRSADLPEDFHHLGVINLDIDDNPKADQDRFLALVKTGKLVYVEAAALSVGGALNSDCWANIRIEIPAPGAKVSRRLKQLLKLPEGHKHSDLVNALHIAYHSALSSLFEKDLKLKVGKSKDLKRTRYLANDSGIYFTEQAKHYSLASLEIELQRLETIQTDLTTFDRIAVNIEASDAFQFADAFAQAKGYSFTKGQRHNFLTSFSIACNLLGVDQAATEAHIIDNYLEGARIEGNYVSFPYQKYKDSFGLWSSRLRTPEAPADDVFDLAPGQRISDVTEKLADLIAEKRLVCLKAGTGTGKSYAAALILPGLLKKRNKCKTVIITSLNAKAAKDGQQYGLPVITGESLRAAGLAKAEVKKQALKSDAILTSQNYFPKLARYFFEQGQQVNVVIDESHSLIAGMKQGFKPGVISELWTAAQAVGATITLLSGTPSPYFRALGFHRVEVRQQQRAPIHCIVKHRQTGDLALTALLHCRQTDFEKKRLVVKIQSKTQLRLTKQLLIQEGFKQEEVLVLYAEKAIKDTPDFQRFLDAKQGQESFADQVKVILTTSVIGEGLDVYGDRFQLEFVNIERASTFDLTALIQFADRWRTDQEKTLVCYFKEATAQIPNFDAMTKFDNLRAFCQQDADRLNSRKAELEKHAARFELLALRTEYSAADRFLNFDAGADVFRVNDLALAAFVEQQKVRHTTTDQGLKAIQESFPYFRIEDQRQVEGQAVTDQDLTGLKEDQTKKRLTAQATLVELWQKDKDLLLQAIGSRTQDERVKGRITFQAERCATVEALVCAHSALFTDYLPEAEQLAKRHFAAADVFLDGGEFEAIAFKSDQLSGQEVFASSESFAGFLTALKLQLLVFVFDIVKGAKVQHNDAWPVLTALQGTDARALTAILQRIEKEKVKGRLDSAAIAKLVNASRRKGSPYLTSRQAVRLVGTFFDLRRVTGKSAAYEIGDRLDFSTWLNRHQIDRKSFCEKLSNRLIINVS